VNTNHIQGTPLRSGPEATMVWEFIETDLPSPRKGESRSVFIEPRLGVSIPDIVAIYWDSSITVSWPEARQSLKDIDLRLVHLLFISGSLSEEKLRAVFPRGLRSSLNQLDMAGLISYTNAFWHLRNPTEIFAVRRIIAFEAKISSISRALEQAYRNTWFASESYVLTPVKQPKASIIERARSRGIGLWLHSGEITHTPFVYAKQHKIPQSYASWVFNELVWRTSLEAS